MIELKPFSLGNARTHYEWNNDEELTYLDSDYPFIRESYESFLQRIVPVANALIGNNQLLEVYSGEHLIGVVGLYGIDKINRRCRLELMIGDRNFRNKGNGQHALFAALKHCFEVMHMHKVTTAAFDFNKKWIHIAEQAGFLQEGVLRHHALKGDKFTDKIIYGILEEDYTVLKSRYSEEAVA